MELHVLGATDDDKLWHAIRKTSTSWPQKFKDVTTLTHSSEGEKFRAVAAATDGQELHVLAATHGGTLLHTIRKPSEWNALQDVDKAVAGELGVTVDAACATDVSRDLHVLVVTNDGKLWHTIRAANTTWPQKFTDVTTLLPREPSSPSGKFRAVAAATTGQELHVVAATREGTLLHTTRKPGEAEFKWDPFRDVEQSAGERGRFAALATAGSP
jgi:hypothetical protein